MSKYHIVIIGSGPAGLSAAARAAYHDQQAGRTEPSYVLLEGFSRISKTIDEYQKGKHVMAEPGFIDLRSDLNFEINTRERILDEWNRGVQASKVNIRYNAEVVGVEGTQGDFTINLKNGEKISAEFVVLGIGLQGNPRKLGVAGEDLPDVAYTLSDPDEFKEQTIVVIGAGDAAIENALALARNNKVYIVNRRSEFSRAKEGNLNAVLAAINNKRLDFSCIYDAGVSEVREYTQDGCKLQIDLKTPDGLKTISCHRVIGRLGAIAPRDFVEKCGITFPSDKPDAIPVLSSKYESNVPGLYIIGALAGYPLIKQAMNQGYDVIEFILGNNIRPVDHELLAARFALLPYHRDVEEVIELLQQQIPMFQQMNALLLRELLNESDLHVSFPKAEMAEAQRSLDQLVRNDTRGRLRPSIAVMEGDFLFRNEDYSNTFFTILEGEVDIRVKNKEGKYLTFTLGPGQFFGEMSLISGRPRNGDAIAKKDCILLETPRRTMLKLVNSNDEIRLGIDWVFITRALQGFFAPRGNVFDIRQIAHATKLNRYVKGDYLYKEGERGDKLFLIRSGTVNLQKNIGGVPISLSQAKTAQVIGEMALLGSPLRHESAIAVSQVETIELSQDALNALFAQDEVGRTKVEEAAAQRLLTNTDVQTYNQRNNRVSFLMDQGLGEATNALVIDTKLCVGCDNCEVACAETHGGISRLNRKAGVGFADLQVPVACRHCEIPHCMKDCPANAIHRAPSGEVFIDDSCIGCGNCESNCVYDVIHMAYPQREKNSVWSWMFLGLGSRPGEKPVDKKKQASEAQGKKAVKCDSCKDLSGGPACVRSCPTGAAKRISPDQFIDILKVQ
ncbi:cyclic nucleotide-binding domain-containing protein [Thalassolituus oleivorans]|uniref:cyclic nucleotide-binding domain-containing protein n=1 Tax=Thalassolituus oleivorans TaxID=187493 RepID=UPI0030C7CB68